MGRYNNVVSISLKAYRKQNKLVQKEMAGKLNISREHYSRLEEGKINPSKKLIVKIYNLTGNQIPFPYECKSSPELEMCSLCAQLNKSGREIIKNKMMKLLKNYNEVQLLVLSILFRLFFNSDF